PGPGAAGMPGASPGLAIPVDITPFRFQPRRIGVDWRRFSAIDVERVAREVDVAMLQEHITSVTFCNLDGEQCPHCGQPADPVLLKVLRMAQLSIEYLLHCQERLGTSLAMHAQQLQAARVELACTQQQAAEQVVQLRGAKEESRRWKKLIVTQQLLLQAGPNTYCKVCDHTLIHSTSLSPGSAERQQMNQVEQMENEVEELKVKLREMQQQLGAEREAEKLRREQEMERARQREEEGKRDLERWKEEEKTKLHEEIDGLRQLFLTAFKDMASRNSAIEGKLQELQARDTAESNLGTLQDDDTEEAQWQAPNWAELRGEQEKTTVLVSSVVPIPGQLLCCEENKKKSHKTGMAVSKYPRGASLTSNLREQLVACSGTGGTYALKEEKGPTSPLSRRSLCIGALVQAPSLTPDREEATLGGKQRLLEALQRNPNLLKQFRPILEEVLEEKLKSMGVKRVAKGISTQTYRSLRALVRLQQQQKAKKFPDLLHLRDDLVRAVMQKVRRCKKPSGALPRQLSAIPGKVTS
ncbi:DZI1L protein, partial [Bucorvus abyssinicus]|nr:DZI1L protein [Bucorvus abyssinicus]